MGYHSYCLRTLSESPDIFHPWDDVKVDGGIFQATSVDSDSRAGEECRTCHRRRNNRGIGSIFCHACGGVDDQPLANHLLQPVLERTRLHLNMRDKKQREEEEERLEQERLGQEEKDDSGE